MLGIIAITAAATASPCILPRVPAQLEPLFEQSATAEQRRTVEESPCVFGGETNWGDADEEMEMIKTRDGRLIIQKVK